MQVQRSIQSYSAHKYDPAKVRRGEKIALPERNWGERVDPQTLQTGVEFELDGRFDDNPELPHQDELISERTVGPIAPSGSGTIRWEPGDIFFNTRTNEYVVYVGVSAVAPGCMYLYPLAECGNDPGALRTNMRLRDRRAVMEDYGTKWSVYNRVDPETVPAVWESESPSGFVSRVFQALSDVF